MVPRELLFNGRLSAHARLVWIILESHANQDRECWPSQDRLAALTGLSKPTIRHCLDCLVAAGLIERRHSANVNHYRVQRKETYFCQEKETYPCEPGSGKNLSSEPEQRKDSFLPEERNLPPQRKEIFPEREPLNENHRTRGTSPPPEELEAFDRILQRAPGYAPSPEFYAKVLERYHDVDFSEEALKLVGWLGTLAARKKHRTANDATILNWLKRAVTEAPQEYRNGSRNGSPRVDSLDALAAYDD